MESTEIGGQYAQTEAPAANRQWQLQANRQWQLQANREYKDRLFKAIFGRDTDESKRWRLDLYNALNGTEYKDPDELMLTTIENVIYITMKNDISFLIGSQMNLYEQRLPLREANGGCPKRNGQPPIILNLQVNSNLLKFKYEQRRKR